MMPTATRSDEILERITSLPPLPAAIGRLLRLVNEPDVEFKEIAKTISLDQTLTAQLLRVANSAYYGFSQQVHSVQQATVILGRYALRNMALSLAMIRLRSHMKQAGPLTPEDFWRHGMAVACGARMLARHCRTVAAEEAFVAGLLHDIGKLVIVEYDRETYGDLLLKAQDGVNPLNLLEIETFGIDHAEIGAALCHHWGLPGIIAAGVAAHHGADTGADEAALELADVVKLANTLVKIGRIGNGGSPLVSATWLSESDTFAQRPDRVRQIVAALAEEAAINEQMFFNRASPLHSVNGHYGKRIAVRISIEDVDCLSLIEFALRSRHGADVTNDYEEADVVIADQFIDESMRWDLTARDVPIRDVTEWRGLQGAGDRWLNLHQLHAWLSKLLTAVRRSVDTP